MNAPAASERRGPRRRAMIALVLSAISIGLMFLLCASGDPRRVVAGDGHYLFAAARSLAYDGDLDLTNQYVVMGDHWGLGRDPAVDGWRLPPREIGASLLMVPGLWLHYGLGLAPTWEPAFACLLAAASLGLCWLGCARCLLALEPLAPVSARDEWRAEALAGGAVLGFVVPYYAWISPGYNHALDAALGAWLCWALCARRSALSIGLLLACAVSLRMQNLLFVLWPLAERLSGGSERRSNRDLAMIVGLAVIGFVPQLWLGAAHPGSARGSLGWTLAFFDLDHFGRDLARVWFGHHGLVRETPLAGLGLAGLVFIAVGRRRESAYEEALAASVVIVALSLLFASVRDVDGGTAFGARRFAGCTALLCLGLGLLGRAIRSRWDRCGTIVLAAIVTLATAANLWRTYEAAAGLRSLSAPASAIDRKSSPSQR